MWFINRIWIAAVNTAVYLLNRSPSKSVDKVPEEFWSDKKPNLAHVGVFGCKAYSFIPAERRRILDCRSIPGIFVGYCLGSKVYKLYDPAKKMVIIPDI